MENTDILKIALRASDIPASWPYCFNSSCQQCDTCLRYQAALTLDTASTVGTTVLPTVLDRNTCPHFKRLRTVRTAWGFDRLFDNVRVADAPTLRKRMRDIVGGNGNYYRYHHGQRRLAPEQQSLIRRLFAEYGYENIEFDHYQAEIEL